jgi:iron-sulfur cluster repair protein YtfE (RIC family)
MDAETIGGLCVRRPLALPILQQLGVTLDQAVSVEICCAASGVDAATVVAAIGAAEDASARTWKDRTIDALIDEVIRAYHRPFAVERDALDVVVQAARDASGVASWSSLLADLAELHADLAQHIEMEERVVFPWLRERAGAAAATIRGLQLEHGDVITHLLAIDVRARRCVADDPANPYAGAVPGAFHRFVQWSCEHIHVESHALFPRALQAELARR